MGIRKLPELSDAVMALVNAGIYSLYALRQPDVATYLLVTDTGERYLLSSAGAILEEGFGRVGKDDVVEAVFFTDLAPSPATVKVNFA